MSLKRSEYILFVERFSLSLSLVLDPAWEALQRLPWGALFSTAVVGELTRMVLFLLLSHNGSEYRMGNGGVVVFKELGGGADIYPVEDTIWSCFTLFIPARVLLFSSLTITRVVVLQPVRVV